MRILIVGAGLVGSSLAQQLSSEGQDVAVLDRDDELVETLNHKADVKTCVGDGSSPAVLEAAGIRESSMVIAVTDSDILNMFVCASAHRYGVKQKIARVRNREFLEDAEDFYRRSFHVDQMTNPENFIAANLSAMVRIPACVDVAEFEDGEILLACFALDEGVPLVGVPIMESRQQHAGIEYLVVAVSRSGRLFIPRGTDRLEAGDHAYVILPKQELERFLPLVTSRPTLGPRKVVLVSGSHEALRLAQTLEEQGHDITVIERDPGRAARASQVLDDALVLRGNAGEQIILQDAKTDSADFFVAAGPEDESNLLTALLAKRMGARRTVVFTREADHLPVLSSIVDIVINPRLATVSAILHLVRKGQILQAAKLGHSEAEAIEFEVPEGALAVGRPISALVIPREAILGAVFRDGAVQIPDGSTELAAHDRVLVFSLPRAIPAMERLFEGRRKRWLP